MGWEDLENKHKTKQMDSSLRFAKYSWMELPKNAVSTRVPLPPVRKFLVAFISLHYSYFKSKSCGLIKMDRAVYNVAAPRTTKEYKGSGPNWTMIYVSPFCPPLITIFVDLRSFYAATWRATASRRNDFIILTFPSAFLNFLRIIRTISLLANPDRSVFTTLPEFREAGGEGVWICLRGRREPFGYISRRGGDFKFIRRCRGYF